MREIRVLNLRQAYAPPERQIKGNAKKNWSGGIA